MLLLILYYHDIMHYILLLLIVLLILLIILVVVLVSLNNNTKHGFMKIANESYKNCNTSIENNIYPSGNIEGSRLILTDAEQEELLKSFILDKGSSDFQLNNEYSIN